MRFFSVFIATLLLASLSPAAALFDVKRCESAPSIVITDKANTVAKNAGEGSSAWKFFRTKSEPIIARSDSVSAPAKGS